jgi:hypothetical protein
LFCGFHARYPNAKERRVKAAWKQKRLEASVLAICASPFLLEGVHFSPKTWVHFDRESNLGYHTGNLADPERSQTLIAGRVSPPAPALLEGCRW